MRLSVVEQTFFGPSGQYGRRVTKVNLSLFTPIRCDMLHVVQQYNTTL